MFTLALAGRVRGRIENYLLALRNICTANHKYASCAFLREYFNPGMQFQNVSVAVCGQVLELFQKREEKMQLLTVGLLYIDQDVK